MVSPAVQAPVASYSAPPVSAEQPVVNSAPEMIGDWQAMIAAMRLEGMTKQLANNCILDIIDDNSCRLIVDAGHQHLCGGVPETKLQLALQKLRGTNLKLVIKPAKVALETPATVLTKANADRQQAAVESINNDENVLALKAQFDARIMPGTMSPYKRLEKNDEKCLG